MPPEPRSEIEFDITPGAIFKAARTLASSPRGRVALRALAKLHKPGGIINLDLANAAAWRVLACAGPGDFNGTVIDAVAETVRDLPTD